MWKEGDLALGPALLPRGLTLSKASHFQTQSLHLGSEQTVPCRSETPPTHVGSFLGEKLRRGL